ncbi:MAG: hypothetical protein J6K94_02160, partial [Ruminiclostridium sp.]|nr:hypothetical protein [Ruminiclostridium sp.]
EFIRDPYGSNLVPPEYINKLKKERKQEIREEKARKIPFTSIEKVVYTPASTARNASLQLFTKEMPNVKRSFWNPYENNMVVVHPGSEELAMQAAEFIRDPYGSNLVPPEYINKLKKERKQEIREEKERQAAEAKEAAEKKET